MSPDSTGSHQNPPYRAHRRERHRASYPVGTVGALPSDTDTDTDTDTDAAADEAARATLGLIAGELPAGEERAGQLDMAGAVATALAHDRHLVVQAGTGTGKTLAYLIP